MTRMSQAVPSCILFSTILLAGAGLGPTGSLAAGPETIVLAQAAAMSAETPVTYSDEQAERGRTRFDADCEECHGGDLKGGLNGGAPLRGNAFEEKYVGAPASVLFSFMSTTMPPNSPGRYSDSTYADLMAYILKRNGFPDGEPLPSDLDALDQIIVQK